MGTRPQRRSKKCQYCGEQTEGNRHGQMCYACHNSEARRNRFNPMRPLWEQFLYRRTPCQPKA